MRTVELRGRVSLSEEVVVLVYGIWFALSLVRQMPSSATRVLKKWDLFGWVPKWQVFGNPTRHDFAFLLRVELNAGWSRWQPVQVTRPRPKWAGAWHPDFILEKALADFVQLALRVEGREARAAFQRSPAFRVLGAYLVDCAAVARPAQAQFMVTAHRAFDPLRSSDCRLLVRSLRATMTAATWASADTMFRAVAFVIGVAELLAGARLVASRRLFGVRQPLDWGGWRSLLTDRPLALLVPASFGVRQVVSLASLQGICAVLLCAAAVRSAPLTIPLAGLVAINGLFSMRLFVGQTAAEGIRSVVCLALLVASLAGSAMARQAGLVFIAVEAVLAVLRGRLVEGTPQRLVRWFVRARRTLHGVLWAPGRGPVDASLSQVGAGRGRDRRHRREPVSARALPSRARCGGVAGSRAHLSRHRGSCDGVRRLFVCLPGRVPGDSLHKHPCPSARLRVTSGFGGT